MIVIIDGYNLLKQVFHKVKGELEKQRNQLIKELSFYKKKKLDNINQIILVFDGGLSKQVDRQIHSEIVVVFAGRKSSADEWILNYVEKHKNKEILLVTKDRELINLCKKYGIDSIDVFDFYDIVQNTVLDKVVEQFEQADQDFTHKYEDDQIEYDQLKGFCKKDSTALDLLMEHAEFNRKDKKDNGQDKSRKSKSQKISKKEKRIYKKIKKL